MSESLPEGVGVALARIEAKMDVVLSNHDTRIDALEALAVDHESRIRAVERAPVVRPAHLAGFAAIVIPIIAIIETWLIATWNKG